MDKTHIIRKRVAGKGRYNGGGCAEVLIYGIEGIDKDLLLDTIQFHREDTTDAPEVFRQRFAVGAWLDISTTTEVRVQSGVGRKMIKGDRVYVVQNYLVEERTAALLAGEIGVAVVFEGHADSIRVHITD